MGLGHMWYITAVLICYFMVPVLDFLLKRVESKVRILLILVVIACLLIGVFQMYSYLAYGINIAFFAVMLCVFKNQRRENSDRWLLSISWFPAILLSGLRIIIGICPFMEGLRNTAIFEGLITVSKCFLAVLLFSLLRCCLACKNTNPIVQYLSRMSYEIYITHQFILLAINRVLLSAGFRGVTNGVLLATISVPLIIANAAVLNKVSTYAKRKIDKVVGAKEL